MGWWVACLLASRRFLRLDNHASWSLGLWRGNHEAWGIKIQNVCRINVLFLCFKFSSWCLVCISNVQLMMLGMHFKMHVLSYVKAIHVQSAHLFISCDVFACVELAWVFYNACNWGFCLVLILWMACDANQQCIIHTQQGVTLSWWQEFVWGLNMYMILWQSTIQIYSYYLQVCIAYDEDHAEA